MDSRTAGIGDIPTRWSVSGVHYRPGTGTRVGGEVMLVVSTRVARRLGIIANGV